MFSIHFVSIDPNHSPATQGLLALFAQEAQTGCHFPKVAHLLSGKARQDLKEDPFKSIAQNHSTHCLLVWSAHSGRVG